MLKAGMFWAPLIVPGKWFRHDHCAIMMHLDRALKEGSGSFSLRDGEGQQHENCFKISETGIFVLTWILLDVRQLNLKPAASIL
jgi:hypothetical protein